MFKINARSKFVDLSKSIKLYYILAIGIFITFLSFALYRDPLTTLVIALAAGAAFFVFGQEPKKILVQMTPEAIDISVDSFSWSKVIEWALVDLGDYVEVIVRVDNTNSAFDLFSLGGFHYFYLKEDQPGFPEFVKYISQNAVYNEELPEKDILHAVLRYVGIA